jgi:hypothetical protein
LDTITDIKLKLINYSRIANELLYEHPKVIKSIIAELVQDIKTYALHHSHTVADYCDKTTLHNWQNESVNYFDNFTSGTTGAPFKYRIWSDIFDIIETACHYDLINKEFGVKPRDVLYLNMNVSVDSAQGPTKNLKTTYTHDVMLTHGGRYKTDIAIPTAQYHDNIYDYILNIFKFKKPYDIVMATQEILEPMIMLIHDKQLPVKRYAKLLSCTGNSTNPKLLREIIDLKLFDNVCDHMRCWDGGATFFTCKYGTRHLCDNLSWCTTDKDYKLLSTDYFSLPSPFINYWNGDTAEIIEDYEKCECDRYFRPFILYAPESSYEISIIYDICGHDNIKHISDINNTIRIYTKTKLPDKQIKLVIIKLDPKTVEFIVENER